MQARLKNSDDGSLVQPFVGLASEIIQLEERVRRLALTDLPVLLVGETGVGKELVAREIHRAARASGARTGEFLVLDCLDLPDDVVLFGQRPGRKGLWERADGGTLFVDGIHELTPRLQAKLLRFLATGEVTPLDSQEPLEINARIIASARGRASALRDAGCMRPDLYYRFGSVIEVPPLRARGRDVRLLADHFLAEFGAPQRLSSAAYQALEQYAWPGNILELRSVLCRALALHPDTLILGPECLFPGGLAPVERVVVEQDCLLDRNWKRAQEGFAQWYWTKLWQRFRGDRQRILEHAGVSHVWLRTLRTRFELGVDWADG